MLLGVQDAKEAFEKVRLFMQSCGLSTRFHEYGIDVDVDALIASVNAERFANNPVPFDAVQLKQLIQSHLI